MAASRLALLILGLGYLVTDVTSQAQCEIPNWQPGLGPNPLDSNRGKVVLIALMKGYCTYCQGQAAALESLKNHLASHGMPDISMILINGGGELSRTHRQNLEAVSNLPVIQDTEDQIMFRQIFRGQKDDFIIYDRCGHRTAYIPRRYSYLGYTITERVLRAVYRGGGGCECSLNNPQRDPHDVMYGDQPSGPRVVVSGSLEMECPPGDVWCRQYLREYGRNDLNSNRMHNRPRYWQIHQRFGQGQEERRHRGRGRNEDRNRGRGYRAHRQSQGHLGGYQGRRHHVAGLNGSM